MPTLQENISLKPYNTFGVEAKAKYFVEAKSENDLFEIFEKVTAEKYEFEKRLIVNELRKHGIYSVLTEPENLTMETINKYLEIKARGIL